MSIHVLLRRSSISCCWIFKDLMDIFSSSAAACWFAHAGAIGCARGRRRDWVGSGGCDSWGVSTAGGRWLEGWLGSGEERSWLGGSAWGWGMTWGCLCGWHLLRSIPVSRAWAVDNLQHPIHNFAMHSLFPGVRAPDFVTHVEFEQCIL